VCVCVCVRVCLTRVTQNIARLQSLITCKVTTCCCTVTSLSGAISMVTRSAACVCHLSGASRQLLTGSPSSHLKSIHNLRPANPPDANIRFRRGSPFKPESHDTRASPGGKCTSFDASAANLGACSPRSIHLATYTQKMKRQAFTGLPTPLCCCEKALARCHDGLQVSCRAGVGVHAVVAKFVVSTRG